MMDIWVFACQTELKSGVLDFGLKWVLDDYYYDFGI